MQQALCGIQAKWFLEHDIQNMKLMKINLLLSKWRVIIDKHHINSIYEKLNTNQICQIQPQALEASCGIRPELLQGSSQNLWQITTIDIITN